MLGLELNFRNLATSLSRPLALKGRKQARVHIADESISFKPRTKHKLKKQMLVNKIRNPQAFSPKCDMTKNKISLQITQM